MSSAKTIANRFFDPTEYIGNQEMFLEVTMKRNELEKAIIEYCGDVEELKDEIKYLEERVHG